MGRLFPCNEVFELSAKSTGYGLRNAWDMIIFLILRTRKLSFHRFPLAPPLNLATHE